MSTYKTNCPSCGAILSKPICGVCGTDSERPLRQKFLSWFAWMRQYPRFAVWVTLAVIGMTFAVVDEHVDFFERHAPKLNAALHGGEITTTGDAAYQMGKWVDDRKKLMDDFASDDWEAMRREMLTRKPYLDDLVLRNDRFQRRIKIEVDGHVDAKDPCQNLTTQEAAPLIARATQVEQEFYSSMASTEKLTPDDATRLGRIDDERRTINRGFADFYHHWQGKGCK